MAQPTPGPEFAPLYTAEEALRDVLSSEWEYLDTGRWPGINRARACVFRNARVFIVNVYCTITEQHAFRIDVYSPERGRVRFYAESKGPVSSHTRAEYFTFTVESEPPGAPDADLPALSLDMTFQALRAYDRQRYEAFLPVCFGGQEHGEPRGACLGALKSRAERFAERNGDFLDRANSDWYWVIRKLRPLAVRYGVEIE